MPNFGNFNPDIQVDKDLFQEEGGIRFPGIVWLGKDQPGRWVLDRYAPNIAEGDFPTPFWKEDEHVFGAPTNDPTPVWTTERLRCVILGYRASALITTQEGRNYRYPPRTPVAERQPGKYTSHHQIMVYVEGLSTPVVIGLKGVSRSNAWTNNQDKYSVGYPVGAYEQILSYVEEASRATQVALPWKCAFWYDFVRAMNPAKPSKPLYITVRAGEATTMNPFTVDLRDASDAPKDPELADLPTRFVGNELFAYMQELRREHAVEWETEWTAAALSRRNGASNGSFDDWGNQPPPPEEDDMPF